MATRARWTERSRLVRARRLWATRNPATFTEKVRYKMLRDHRDLVVTFADKAAVRAYVTAQVGAQHLPRLHHLLDDPADLARVTLPPAYVVKPTHGSGVALVVSPSAPPHAALPEPSAGWVYRQVRPDAVDVAALVALCSAWLTQLYGQGPNREWAYGRMPRRILVEELLAGADGAIPDDYKFFVFHGACRFVQVDRGRFDDRTQDFFTPQWEHLELSGGPAWAHPAVPRPDRLAQMIDLAQRLGADTDFVRVDLYLLPDRIVVGELTNYPAGGDSPFHPASFDAEFGSHWQVPRRYV